MKRNPPSAHTKRGQTQITPTEDSLLAELDSIYERFRQVEQVAVWGGSFEREHGAMMELKTIANAMFTKLTELMSLRKASRPKAADSVGRGSEKV